MKVPEGAKILGITVPRAGTDETEELLAQRREGYEAIGAPPDHLSEDSRAVWVELRHLVADLPYVRPHHRPIFEALVEQIRLMRAAAAELAESGLVKPGNRNGTVKNPAANILEAAARTARGLARELGMTPASEAELMKKIVVEPESPWSDDAPEWLHELRPDLPRRR